MMKHLSCSALAFCLLMASTTAVVADTTSVITARSPKQPGVNPAVVVIRSAAKGTWAVTKFSAQHLAKPVAKKVLLQATPAMTKFVLKSAAKNALPLVLKLSVL